MKLQMKHVANIITLCLICLGFIPLWLTYSQERPKAHVAAVEKTAVVSAETLADKAAKIAVGEDPKTISHDDMVLKWDREKSPYITTPMNAEGHLDITQVTALHNFPLNKVEIREVNMGKLLKLMKAMNYEGCFSEATQRRVDQTIEKLEQ